MRALNHAGFDVLLVIIPRPHTIKAGTLKHIWGAAEISSERFKDLL